MNFVIISSNVPIFYNIVLFVNSFQQPRQILFFAFEKIEFKFVLYSNDFSTGEGIHTKRL